jgi:hypothetical protein
LFVVCVGCVVCLCFVFVCVLICFGNMFTSISRITHLGMFTSLL